MDILNHTLVDDLCNHAKSLLIDSSRYVFFIPPEQFKARHHMKYLQETFSSGEEIAFLVLAKVTGIGQTILPSLEEYKFFLSKYINVITVVSSHISIQYASKQTQQIDFQDLSLDFSFFSPEIRIDFFLILGTWMSTEKNPKIPFKIGQKETM